MNDLQTAPEELQPMTANRLLHEFALRCPNRMLPDSYLVCDTETSGFSVDRDLILQYGFCVVVDREVHSSFAIIIDRGPDMVISKGALECHGITHERMKKEGVAPAEGIGMIMDTFSTYRKNGLMFVGHNIINFDAPFFEYEARNAGRPFKFGDNEILDTGMIVKASRLGMYYDKMDTLRSFAKRVSSVRARGVKWSLDGYCFDSFDLGRRAGVYKDEAHDAGVDCLLTHHLFEALREGVTSCQ